MRKLIKELKNRKIDYNVLLESGFILENNTYKYEQSILNNEFKVIIEISNNEMTSKLIETELNDEFLLADVETTGEYIGKIKEEYNKVIENVISKCTQKDIFRETQTKEIIFYVKEKYNDNLEFLWETSPNNAIWRNKKNNKWYAAILTVSKRKLNIDSDELIEIIDLLYEKGKTEEIIDNKKIFPGYHMNKKSWITIKLDNSMKTEEICKLIDNSYKLSLKKL